MNGSLGLAAFGRIFRTYRSFCNDFFSIYLNFAYAYEAELFSMTNELYLLLSIAKGSSGLKMTLLTL